ncbi:MAG: mitochondrial inner membrane protein required for protein import [Trizodia sp. TS-e1964]|nr:MAG: mitochondrial inner membrane protein required for protein import [Trizodia sp. TS-e1964]
MLGRSPFRRPILASLSSRPLTKSNWKRDFADQNRAQRPNEPKPPRGYPKSSPISQETISQAIKSESRTNTPFNSNQFPPKGIFEAASNEPPSAQNLPSIPKLDKTTQESLEESSPTGTSPKPAGDIPFKPLPDLTRGIPSTLEDESPSSTKSTQSLNLTEDPASAQSNSRRGGGLPKEAYISSLERRRNRVANFLYAGFLIFSVTGTIYMGRNWETKEEEERHPDAPSGWGIGLFFNRATARIGDMLGYYTEPVFPKLLPDTDPSWERPMTLVLSLEDLLIHSEWTRDNGWRMAKRPGVDYFLRYLSQYYELVLFTSVPSMVADPIIRKLDPYRLVMPLFREATRYRNGDHIKVCCGSLNTRFILMHLSKDLSYLNRDLSKVILIDTVPVHAKLQPENAIILPKWTGDPNDKELVSLIPFLEAIVSMGLTDTRKVLESFKGKHIPTEFARREQAARLQLQAQLLEEQAKRPKISGLGYLSSILGIKPSLGGPDGMELTPSQALEKGITVHDQIRERGQKQYEVLEKQIRENGEQWLKEMAAEEEKMKAEQMKGMRSSLPSFLGGEK